MNGNVSYFDCVDVEEFSVLDLSDMVNQLGYKANVMMCYHFKKLDGDLDNGLHSLGNDHDVITLSEYVKLGHREIDVYVQHDRTPLHQVYQEADFRTPKNSCIIEEIPAQKPSKLKPMKLGKSSCARNLLGWNDIRERLVVGQSSQVSEVGQSSQSKPTLNDQPSSFVEDFYSIDDPFMGNDDFQQLVGLENLKAVVEGPSIDVGDKGKGVAVDDGAVNLGEDVDIAHSTDEEQSDGYVDEENPLEHVAVNMDTFDASNADKMGTTELPKEFNANEEIEVDVDVDVDVMDVDEFESASDEDGLDRIRKRKVKQLMKKGNPKDGSLHKTVFFVGQEFGSADEVKENIHLLAIETRREIFLKKNDKERVRAECRGTIPVFEESEKHVSSGGLNEASGSSPTNKWTRKKVGESKGFSPKPKSKQVGGKPNARKLAANQCPWVLHVSKLRDLETWKVKTFDDNHKCLQSRKIKYCTADFLSGDIMQQIESNPEIPIRSLQDQLQKKYHLEISKMKAFRAKSKAVDNVRGDFTLQYNMLRDYVMELKSSNPNTTVRIGV